MPQIDFVITNPRHHLAMTIPVIRRLHGHGLEPRVLSLCELRGYDTPGYELDALGIDWKRLVPLRLSKDSSQLRVVRDRAIGRTRRWIQDSVWHGLIRWRHRLGRWRPALAVVPNDTAFPYNRIVTLLHDDGIPFLLMQEGVRFELPSFSTGRQYGQGGARAVAAWGDASVRYFRSIGVPAARVYAVGNPRLDVIRSRDWSEPARALQASLRLDQRAVLLLTNPIDLQGFCSAHDKYRLIASLLTEAMPMLATLRVPVVIKIHPSESLPAYRAIAASAGEAVRVIRDADPFALFQLGAAVVVLGSTAGLEAMLFDLPVGVLEAPGGGFLHDYVESGAAVPLRPGAIRPAVDELLADGDPRRAARRRYLHDQIANLGRSADVAGGLIVELAREVARS